jgi:hypothetical protein
MEMDSTLLDEWLDELRRRRWTHHYFPNREAPKVHASLYRWDHVVDVVALFTDADALAYRAPMSPDHDPFRPPIVTWVFAGEPIWAIRAVLALPEPGADGEPSHAQPAPPLCATLAELATRNRVIRPPA